MADTMIEHADKLHLFAVCVQTLVEIRTFITRYAATSRLCMMQMIERLLLGGYRALLGDAEPDSIYIRHGSISLQTGLTKGQAGSSA